MDGGSEGEGDSDGEDSLLTPHVKANFFGACHHRLQHLVGRNLCSGRNGEATQSVSTIVAQNWYPCPQTD